MKLAILAVALCLAAFCPLSLRAQHCAPIVESYLSDIQVHNRDAALSVRVNFAKTGGRLQPAYQGYLVAYWAGDAPEVPGVAPAPLLDSKRVVVLGTALMKRAEDGTYPLDTEVTHQQLAEKLIALKQFGPQDEIDSGGWKRFRDSFQIAVFVPFLEDSAHSTLEGLPDDRHECNYPGDRALLFQVLPHSFSIHFGVVQARRLPEGNFRIQVNGQRPLRPDR